MHGDAGSSATAATPRNPQHFCCTCHQGCLRHNSAVRHLWLPSFPGADPGALTPNFQIFDPNTKSLREGEKGGQFPGRFPSSIPPKHQWDPFSGIHSTKPLHHQLCEVLHLWQMALTFGQCCWERSAHSEQHLNVKTVLSTDRQTPNSSVQPLSRTSHCYSTLAGEKMCLRHIILSFYHLPYSFHVMMTHSQAQGHHVLKELPVWCAAPLGHQQVLLVCGTQWHKDLTI